MFNYSVLLLLRQTEGGDGELQCHDLRKVRSASHMRSSVGDVDVDGGCPLALERGAPLVVHCQSQLTFYLQSDISAETERWLQVRFPRRT